MNVTRAFANYLEAAGVATLGQDLFISRAPSSLRATDRLFWIKSNGGGTEERSVNGGSIKDYAVEVRLRDVDAEDVYETLQELGEDVTCAGCVTLEGYDVQKIKTNGPWTDQDLDNEERTVGLLQVTITIHKEC